MVKRLPQARAALSHKTCTKARHMGRNNSSLGTAPTPSPHLPWRRMSTLPRCASTRVILFRAGFTCRFFVPLLLKYLCEKCAANRRCWCTACLQVVIHNANARSFGNKFDWIEGMQFTTNTGRVQGFGCVANGQNQCSSPTFLTSSPPAGHPNAIVGEYTQFWPEHPHACIFASCPTAPLLSVAGV